MGIQYPVLCCGAGTPSVSKESSGAVLWHQVFYKGDAAGPDCASENTDLRKKRKNPRRDCHMTSMLVNKPSRTPAASFQNYYSQMNRESQAENVTLVCESIVLQEIFHSAAEGFTDSEQCFGSCFVDIPLALFKQLDLPQRNIGLFSQFRLR